MDKRVQQIISIFRNGNYEFDSSKKILDLGCGNGKLVQYFREAGFEAYGCDIKFKPGPLVNDLANNGLIKEIDIVNYSIPFEDDYFDFVYSDQVFEHVQNYDETIAELSRVMKPSGASLHIFPSRYSPIEPHFKVPFGTIIHSRAYYLFWAKLGIRKPSQKGWNAEKVADDNVRYIQNVTNYLPQHKIRKYFATYFDHVAFSEKQFLKFSFRGKLLYKATKVFPFVGTIYRILKSNVVMTSHKIHPTSITPVASGLYNVTNAFDIEGMIAEPELY